MDKGSMSKGNTLDTILRRHDAAYSDGIENSDDKIIDDTKQQIALAIERAKPEKIEADNIQSISPEQEARNKAIEDYHNNLKRELGL